MVLRNSNIFTLHEAGKRNETYWVAYESSRRQAAGSGTKEELIKEYIKNNPNANITEIAKTLGISRTTVYKYYDKIWQELFGILVQSDKQTIL